MRGASCRGLWACLPVSSQAVIDVPGKRGHRHPALSDEFPLSWRGQSLFPRAVQPAVFTLLWVFIAALTAGLAVIGAFYLHDIGA